MTLLLFTNYYVFECNLFYLYDFEYIGSLIEIKIIDISRKNIYIYK